MNLESKILEYLTKIDGKTWVNKKVVAHDLALIANESNPLQNVTLSTGEVPKALPKFKDIIGLFKEEK
jgi:hypothetical protein